MGGITGNVKEHLQNRIKNTNTEVQTPHGYTSGGTKIHTNFLYLG